MVRYTLHVMKRESLVFFLGFVLMLAPFLGIPSLWKRVVYVALGCVLALVGYQLRRFAYLRSIENGNGERRTAVYVEQVPLEAQSLMGQIEGSVLRSIKPDESEASRAPGATANMRPRRTRTALIRDKTQTPVSAVSNVEDV